MDEVRTYTRLQSRSYVEIHPRSCVKTIDVSFNFSRHHLVELSLQHPHPKRSRELLVLNQHEMKPRILHHPLVQITTDTAKTFTIKLELLIRQGRHGDGIRIWMVFEYGMLYCRNSGGLRISGASN